MEWEKTAKYAWRAIFLLALVLILLGVLTWTGIIKCSIIPGWCDAYFGFLRWTTGGQPRVAIVFGDDGLGNPDLLAELLANPKILAVHADMIGIEHAELGNIKNYDLVIVEKARTIGTKKLDMFMDYVYKHGGKLVWTGDAGTRLAKNDRPLYVEQRDDIPLCEDVMRKRKISEDELEKLNLECVFEKNAQAIGPWARVRGDDTILSFDQFLGLQYHGNFCELTTMNPEEAALCYQQKRMVGRLVPEPTRSHPLVYGMRTDLALHGDFGVVEELSGGYSTRALSVGFEGRITVVKDQNKSVDLGNVLPIIQTSGIGERIAYYAVPPEQFALQPMNYISIVENMYVGMLKG